jgi:hypothetical protein
MSPVFYYFKFRQAIDYDIVVKPSSKGVSSTVAPGVTCLLAPYRNYHGLNSAEPQDDVQK